MKNRVPILGLWTPHIMNNEICIGADQKEHWKAGYPSLAPFKVNDIVLRKIQLPGNLVSNKCKPKFTGPYRVMRVQSNGVSYELEDSGQTRLVHAHQTQLKQYNFSPSNIRNHHSYTPANEGKFRVEFQ